MTTYPSLTPQLPTGCGPSDLCGRTTFDGSGVEAKWRLTTPALMLAWTGMESTVAPINRIAVVSEEVRWQRTCKVAAVGRRRGSDGWRRRVGGMVGRRGGDRRV